MKNQSLWQSFQEGYRNAIRHTKYRWVVILGTLFYLVSPLDISPDFLPGLGWIDDGLLASLLIAEVSQMMMERVKDKKGAKASVAETESVIDVEAVSVS
ncbi:MAG: YkvA family protein [Cyanobacteria bacterium P01_A01_bin.17]